MGTNTTDKRSAIDKAMHVLNAFGDQAYTGIGVTEIARRTNLPKSTAFRVLASLQANGAVERVGDHYRLGKMIQDLAHNDESDFQQTMRDMLTPFLANLYSRTKRPCT